MRKNIFSYCLTVLIFLTFSCSSDYKEYAQEVGYDMLEEESIPASGLSEPAPGDIHTALASSAAIIGEQDSIRKFIRTARLQFKTPDVIRTVYAIEDIAIRLNGFTQQSNLYSDTNYSKRIKVSKDSTLLLTYYIIKADLVIRVPVSALDATLKDIIPFITYLDYRQIEANDVQLLLLSNRLTQARERKGTERVEKAIDHRGQKLRETIEGEELLSEKQRRLDEALLSTLYMEDKINYSTIYLSVYQNESIKKELIANEENIAAYQQGFGSRIIESLKWGGKTFIEVIVSLVNLWAFVLLIVGVIVVYKKYKKRKQK